MTNIPSPYRVDFFNELGKLCDLTVLFERRSADDREINWVSNNEIHFKAEYLYGKNFGSDSAICPGVTRWLHRNMFDNFIVGGYATPTGIIAIETLRLRRIPFILNADGGFIRNENKLKYCTKKYLIGQAKYYLSTGKATSKYLMHYGAKFNEIYEYPFSSLYNNDILTKAISYEEKQEIKKSMQINEDKIILSVGQFIHRKGFDVLLEACAKLPRDYGVYIVGGEPAQKYRDLKEKFELDNVHFVSFRSKEELKKYYLASNLFVLPTREDIWGLVVNEAMAYGLPVITTDRCIAGLELINAYENGFIVEIERPMELADRIEEILSDGQLSIKMGNANLDKIRSYTIENMARQHFKIFNSLEDRAGKNEL